jgi:hypothetical protein
MEIKDSYKDAIRAIDLYRKATRKDLPEIMNKFNKDVALQTIRFMPIASKSKIEQYDPERMTKRSRVKAKTFYIKAQRAGFKRGQGLKKEAIRRFNRAKSSRGFLKSLFFNIAGDFGAPMRNSPRAGGESSKSHGVRASITKLRAEMISGLAEETAHKVILPAFKRALAFKTKDMEEYARRKMKEQSGKYSGRII